MKHTLNLLDNLISSAKNNMLKDSNTQSIISVQDAKDLATPEAKPVSPEVQKRSDFLVETTNLLVHELKTLQMELQGQKTYCQKIEEELRRLKTLSHYYPLNNDMVIHEATISFDGSESKMTLSNVDANEIRGKRGIIRFEEAVQEELRIRSETKSPMFFNLDSIQELALEDITPELTPVTHNRFRKNKNNPAHQHKNDGL